MINATSCQWRNIEHRAGDRVRKTAGRLAAGARRAGARRPGTLKPATVPGITDHVLRLFENAGVTMGRVPDRDITRGSAISPRDASS